MIFGMTFTQLFWVIIYIVAIFGFVDSITKFIKLVGNENTPWRRVFAQFLMVLFAGFVFYGAWLGLKGAQ